jgi:hypothetical protein
MHRAHSRIRLSWSSSHHHSLAVSSFDASSCGGSNNVIVVKDPSSTYDAEVMTADDELLREALAKHKGGRTV